MTVLDTNIVAIVLPQIASGLDASFAQVEWIISIYLLCLTVLLLPAGVLADRIGHKRAFLYGITGFAIASFMCGTAVTPPQLLVARAVQGAGSAFLLAPALAIIGHSFRDEQERNFAWALWGGIMGLTMVLSPLLGGALAALAGWRWAFFINLPVCAALMTATRLFIGHSCSDRARKLDPPGILLFAFAMLGMIWALIHGQAHGWSVGGTVGRFAAGLVALLLFILVESRQRKPMLDLGLFKQRRFVGAILAMFAYAASAQVMASLLPLLLQNGFALNPIEAGGAMLAFAVAMLVFPQVGRRLNHVFADYQILSFGLAVVAAGNLLAAGGAYTTRLPLLLAGMFVLGAGGGLLNGETQKAVMGSVPHERSGMASGISTTTRFAGILLGFAILGGVLATSVRRLLTSRQMGNGFADAVVAGDLARAVTTLPPALRTSAEQVALQTYSVGFATALLCSAFWAACAAVAVPAMMHARKCETYR